MNIAAILGSPRRAGNTARVLGAFERLAAASHEVFRINIAEKRVGGCLGCDACQSKPDAPGCRQQDDFAEVMDHIMRSDVVVYSTPVYVWDFPAQMKALIDRHYCMVKWKGLQRSRCLLGEKRTMLLATCGGDAAHNADLLQEIFRREMGYLHCRIVGMYIVPLCTVPSALGGKPEDVAHTMMEGLS